MAGNVVDYGFYLIQRGEAGHRRGCYLNEYKDSGGIETIGYGTVTRPGYNTLNYRQTTITEEKAIELAKQEMAVKINEKCRTKFKDFDNLLPCYQAAILDTTYQGNWGAIQNAMNERKMQEVYQAIINNPNRERAAVRGRAIEMGMLIEQAYKFNPDADPKMVADSLAQILIENYGYLNGTDSELTKDELALLYRSVMAAYGVEVEEAQIEKFAMSYTEVASGMCGIGSSQQTGLFSGYIPAGPSYDGSRSAPYSPLQPGTGSRGYHSFSSMSDRYSGYNYAPIPFKPMPAGENQFEPDSKELEVSTCFPTCNYSAPRAKKQMIVLHTTESSSLSSTVATFQNPGSKVSAHYTIDRDGRIFQHLPEGYTAWHAGASSYAPLGISGSCNAESIGIEVQRAPNQELTPAQIASMMALVKDIQKRQGILPEHVVAHSDVAPGRKADPGPDCPWGAMAAEGIALPREYHGGMGDCNPALAGVRSSDCQYYKRPDYDSSRVAFMSEKVEEARTDKRTKNEQSAEERRKAEETRLAAEEERKRMLESSLIQTLIKAEEAGAADAARKAAEEKAATEETATDSDTENTGEESKAKKKSSGKKKKKSSGKKKSEKSSSKENEVSEKENDNNEETLSTLEKSSDGKVSDVEAPRVVEEHASAKKVIEKDASR